MIKIRELIKQVILRFYNVLFYYPIGGYTYRASLVKHMAKTGLGTEECINKKCLPMNIDFYSPVPDIEDIVDRGVCGEVKSTKDIAWDVSKQIDLLKKLSSKFSEECIWPYDKTSNTNDFYINNSGFSYGCATALHSMIRDNAPNRIVEIGSGMSSRIINGAINKNVQEGKCSSKYTIIDPYPSNTLGTLSFLTDVKKTKVELLSLDIFKELKENDILFVDSGHTVRIGGDVNYLILDVLPILNEGVYIHFHDIPFPYEYSELYLTNKKFRMFWTESYLLQAFLLFNESFETVLPMNYLMKKHRKLYSSLWKHYDSELYKDDSHSYWIRKIK